jgi:Flp pilus assembly protein TadG
MRRRQRERGTQLLELAIMMPLLCLIILAITDGADLVRTHVLLNNAAREGARMSASLYCPTCNKNATVPTIQSYILQYINTETDGKGIGGTGGKDAWCTPSQLTASNIIVNTATSYAYSDPSISSGNNQGKATQVSIDFTYTFCFVPNFANMFPGVGISNTVPLHTESTFYNMY